MPISCPAGAVMVQRGGFKGHNQFVFGGVAIVTYEFLSANIISSLMNTHMHTCSRESFRPVPNFEGNPFGYAGDCVLNLTRVRVRETVTGDEEQELHSENGD